jgi:lysophospholipase L1-like esterase
MAEQTAQSQSNNRVDALKLDPNMRLEQNEQSGLKWLSPKEQPFRISGFPWFPQDNIYRRLPAQPNYELPAAVDSLANSTAGGQIAFTTDSPRLALRVELAGEAGMYHMPATGQCGFDVYLGEPGDQQYYGTTRFDHSKSSYEAALYDEPVRQLRHVTLNFPLYQGVNEVSIGIEPGCSIAAPLPYRSSKKVIVYGTSVTQGGCASRPGMACSNILSRRIPLEFMNLGFSGNGKGEPEVARVVSEIADPALLVLEYEGNVRIVDQMRQTLPEFIRIYREVHPETPILVISRFKYARERFDPRLLQRRLDMKRVETDTVDLYRRQGDNNIHFLDGEALLGTDSYNECTVDGAHPTDLGFMRMADTLTPVFKELLKGELG